MRKVLFTFFVFLAVPVGQSLFAADVLVRVTGIKSNDGQIGIALFDQSQGFPMDSTDADQQWLAPKQGAIEFRFTNLKPGTYAIAVAHDLNRNGKTDTNFLGIPKEDWGVSNNVRPRMRAPKFKEASFQLNDDMTIEIEID